VWGGEPIDIRRIFVCPLGEGVSATRRQLNLTARAITE
jgi:hypothetical protein